MWARLTGAFGAAAGSAFGLIVVAVAIFSLPLSLLAMIRITGWDWWVALICLMLLSIVPLLGQIGLFGLILVGGYYFVDSGFNWQTASGRVPKVANIQELSAEEIEKYKQLTMSPALERQCQSELSKGLGGKVMLSTINFCKCYVKIALAEMTVDEIEYQQVNHAASREYTDIVMSRSAECR